MTPIPFRLKSKLIKPLFGLCIVLLIPGISLAQPDEDEGAALKKANAQLASLLDDAEGVFYKEVTNEDGSVYFTVVWESQGESTRIGMNVRNIGYYGGKYVHRVFMFSNIIDSEDPLPPATIKALANSGNKTLFGAGMCSNDFKTAYSVSDGILEGMTAGGLWMHCSYVHINRKGLKEIIDQAMSGANG